MKKKSQTEQNSMLDITEYFNILNEKMDTNTRIINAFEKQFDILMKKINKIEQFIFKQQINSSGDISQDSDSSGFESDEQSPKNKQEDDNKNEEIKNVSNAEDKKKKIQIKKTIVKPVTPKIAKLNNLTTENRDQSNPKLKMQNIKKNQEMNNEEEDQNENDKIDIQKELSRSMKTIDLIQKSISNSINHMNETFICENLDEMKCFSKIEWNTKNLEIENQSVSFTKYDCKYDIYAEDQKNRKYYFEVSSSTKSSNQLGFKLNHEKESFILANVKNTLKIPKIKYYLYIPNKTFVKIRYHGNQSFIKTILKMKIQNEIIKEKETKIEEENKEEEENKKEEEEDNNDNNDDDDDNEEIKTSIVIRRKKNGKFTDSTIMRKIKNIRKTKRLDFQEELTKSRLRINKLENTISFNIGYMGEAYTYENLLKMTCFQKVVWNANTSDSKNPSVLIKGKKKFYIQEDGGQYDIYAIDKQGKLYYFEIKSSSNATESKDISDEQKKFCNKINQKNESFIISRVSKVLDSPVIKYILCLNDKRIPIEMTKNKSLVEVIGELKAKHNCNEDSNDESNQNDNDNNSDNANNNINDNDVSNNQIDKDDFYKCTKAPRKLKIPNTLKQNEHFGKTFEYSPKNDFNGIINYLRNKSNGNLENEVIITSSSVISDDHRPKNVAIYDQNVTFFSNILKNQNEWIKFDFQKYQIMPTYYTIRSIEGGAQYFHPKSWVIEGSNDDENWNEIDVRKEDPSLNGNRIVHTFKINQSSQKFSFIRMRLTTVNWKHTKNLAIESFEIYGTLFNL